MNGGSSPRVPNALLTCIAAVALCILQFGGCRTGRSGRKAPPQVKVDSGVRVVLGRYETALGQRNWKGILALVSPHYRDMKGTPDPKDDEDYRALEKRLSSLNLHKGIKRVVVHLKVRSYRRKGDSAEATVSLSFSFVYDRGAYKPGFKSGITVQRISLARTGGRWMIVSGL